MAGAGDSYIGSLISLISKYEIRYEGVLYQLNVQDSTIALKNVRSYGTEGRKKDGQQVPPSDKVYEYILFRGSDIKDLQVKSSPPAKTEEQINNDPAIIQSQYANVSSGISTPLASVGKDSLTESTQWKDTPALGSRGYPGTFSSYHTATQVGHSEHSPMAPTAMYQQGYPGTFVSSHIPQHHIAVQPPPVMSNPLAMQQMIQAAEIQASTSLGSASSSEFISPVSSASISTSLNPKFSPSMSTVQYPTPLNVPLSASAEASRPSHSISLTANTLTMPSLPLSHQDLDVNETQIVHKAVSNSIQALSVQTASTEVSLPSHSASFAANTLSMPSLPFSHQDLNAIETQIFHKAVYDSNQVLPVKTMSYPTTFTGSNLDPLLRSSPSLLRPEISAHSGSHILPSTQNLYPSQKDVGALAPMPSNSSSPLPTLVTQVPLLPLPTSAQKFTEEFDFEAMNEKFKKDEVWGYLGKAKQVNNTDGGEENIAGHCLEEKEGHDLATKHKPAYNKDDFFDSISCTSLARAPRIGHNRFFGRMKQDTETFGFQQSPNSGYGGYGAGRGENFRGPQNWGRGYGYHGGRGRGGNIYF